MSGCQENAFRFFGGVTKTIVPDATSKAAVIQADWYDPELQPEVVASFAEHYGTVIVPAKPAMYPGTKEKSKPA